jgi:ribosomal protein L37AE/L43A
MFMAGFGGMRKGRREAVENLGYSEEGDCPRCGGESDSSTMAGYLRCLKCSHEWADPEYTEDKNEIEIPTYHRDAELIEQFKRDVESGSLANVLGVKKKPFLRTRRIVNPS